MGKHSGKDGDTWDFSQTPEEKADNFDRYDEHITHEPPLYPAIENYEKNQKGK